MKLVDYIPENPFLKSKIIKKLFEGRQLVLDKVKYDIDDINNQAYISTATWGLKHWEEEFGIPIDLTDTYENRRARCLAHIRGRGNPTLQHIKDTALSYQCGEINVNEFFEEGYVEIEFVGKVGIPPKMEDFKDIIRKLIPAHLDITYKYKYNTWGDIYNSFNSWSEVMDYFDSWEEVMTKPINKAEIAKRLHSIYYLDNATNSYKRLTFKK